MNRSRFYLAYPFHHDFTDRELCEGAGISSPPWAHWHTRLSDDDYAVAIDHSYSFVPPVKGLLFPEFFGVDRDALVENRPTSARDVLGVRARQHEDDWRRLYVHRALRLTWATETIWLRRPVTVEFKHEGTYFEIPVIVAWADVMLLPDHVGVVVLRVDPGVDLSLDEFALLSRHLKKLVFRRRLTVDVPNLRLADGSSTRWADVLARLLSGLERTRAQKEDLLLRNEHSESRGFNWRMAAIVELCEDRKPNEPFDSWLAQAAFAVATGRGPSEPQNFPSHEFLARLLSDRSLRLWNNWMGMFHYDNFVMAVDTKGERRQREFDAHLENFEYEYLIIFLFAAAQRSALDLFAGDLARIGGDDRSALARLDSLQRDLIRFNTRLWYDEIGTTPVGPHIYRLLQAGYGAQHAYSQVFNDADQLRKHLQLRGESQRAATARQTESLLQFLTVVALPLTFYVTLFAPVLLRAGPVSRLSPWTAWTVMAAVAAVLGGAWYVLAHLRRSDEDEL